MSIVKPYLWLPVNDPQLFTPGGDPLYRCPKCGKGVHCNGVEFPNRLDSCPDCGVSIDGYADDHA